MYTPKSAFKPVGKASPGAAKARLPNVVIIESDKIISAPQRNSGGVKMEGNWEFVDGYEPQQLYLTPSTHSSGYESEGDEDAVSLSQNYEGKHPGDSLEVDEFVQYYLGKNVIILSGSCQDDYKKVYGTECAPLQLQPNAVDDNDGSGVTMSFTQFQKSAMVRGHYEGDWPTGSAHEVADLENIQVNETNGAVYRLPANTAGDEIDFAGIDLASGTFITLIGGGGSTPAELKTSGLGGKVLLKGGTDWAALAGARIDLEVFSAGADNYLVERRRY